MEEWRFRGQFYGVGIIGADHYYNAEQRLCNASATPLRHHRSVVEALHVEALHKKQRFFNAFSTLLQRFCTTPGKYATPLQLNASSTLLHCGEICNDSLMLLQRFRGVEDKSQ